MKNDIDSILESMFRGGRLHFKSSQPTETSGEDKVPSSQSKAVVSQAQANAQEAQRALDAVDSAGDQLSQSLQQSLERLTQEAKADMADLERHLRQDGVDTQTVARNAGDPVDLEMAFPTRSFPSRPAACAWNGETGPGLCWTAPCKTPGIAGAQKR